MATRSLREGGSEWTQAQQADKMNLSRIHMNQSAGPKMMLRPHRCKMVTGKQTERRPYMVKISNKSELVIMVHRLKFHLRRLQQ